MFEVVQVITYGALTPVRGVIKEIYLDLLVLKIIIS